MKKIFIGILFLFLMGEVFRLDFTNGASLRSLDVGVGIFVSIWIASKFLKKKKIEPRHILISMLLFAGSGTLSLLINFFNLTINQFLISLMYLLRWITYAGIFLVVYNFDNNFKKMIVKLLIFFGSLVVFLGYLQYFFYPSLKNLFYLGWDEHMYRMFSVFLDPNFAGAFFVLFFLFLVSLFLKKKSKLIGLLAVLTLGAVFLTFSRSALIMLIVSSSLLFILMKKKRWIAILVIIIFLFLGISSRHFNIENINLFRVVSSEARLETAREAIEIIKINPIFGVGFNAYRYAKFNYTLKPQGIKVISHADAGTDNSFLFVLATTGVVGFILYLFLWLKVLRFASAVGIASIAGVFVDSMFINSLFYPFIMFWLWIVLALSTKNHN